MRNKNAKIKAIVMAAVISVTSLTPTLADDKTWAYEKGSISSDYYIISVSGSSTELTATTQYANGYVDLSATISGKYVGTNFKGIKTKTETDSDRWKASIKILASGTNRFTGFSSTHRINKTYRYFSNVAVY